MENFKNNKKFQSTVGKAKELFWKHGIRRVSIEEICAATPVSKMTFYKFFKKKEMLAEYILKEVLYGWHQGYIEIMKLDLSFTEKIKKVIDLEQSASENMSEEFIKDIYNNEFTELQKLITSERDKYHAEIVNDMIKAQKRSEIRQDIKPEFILYLLEDIGNKVMDEKISKLYNSKQELIMEVTNYFFYGIINSKE